MAGDQLAKHREGHLTIECEAGQQADAQGVQREQGGLLAGVVVWVILDELDRPPVGIGDAVGPLFVLERLEERIPEDFHKKTGDRLGPILSFGRRIAKQEAGIGIAGQGSYGFHIAQVFLLQRRPRDRRVNRVVLRLPVAQLLQPVEQVVLLPWDEVALVVAVHIGIGSLVGVDE